MVERIKMGKRGILAGIVVLLVLAVVSIIVFYAVVPMTINRTTKNVSTKIASDYEADKIYLPGETPKFRSSAKFKILEIVPYRGMAEVGYGIAGEEPVDITKISRNDYNNEMFQVIHTNSDILVWNETENHLVNQNTFVTTTLKEGLRLTDAQVQNYIENHSVDVLVVEPEALNRNLKLIDQADYIYIHDNFYHGSSAYFRRLVKFYETYSYEALHTPDMVKYSITGNYPRFYGEGDQSTDLSDEAVRKLFYYTLIDKMPLTFSGYTAKQEASGKTNSQKLGYAITVAELLNYMGIKPVSETYHDLFFTEHDDTWNFWNVKSMVQYLLPTATNTERDGWVAAIESGYSSAVDNDFVGDYTETTACALAHGDGQESSILSKLGSGDSYSGRITETEEEDWCKGVNNNTRDIAISIMNSLKPTFRVLDIEPDNKFELDAITIKSWIPKGTKVKIDIATMTMSEFIGIVDDINSTYDMIYFGKNVNRMTGDKLYYTNVSGGGATLAGYQGESVRGTDYAYSGNDITDWMIDKVKAFMKAGYPVAYEKDLKEPLKINTDTKIYQFINENCGDMYQVTNGKTITGGASEGLIDASDILLGKPELYHTLNSGVEEYDESVTSQIGTDGLNSMQISTKYGSGTYRAYLYIDTDHNGVFNQWKESGGMYSLDPNYEQPIWSQEFDAAHTVNVSGATIPTSAMLGTVSYKLEVVKLQDGALTGIRAYLSGHVRCINAGEHIAVLQLSDLTSYPEMDFTSGSNEAASFWKMANSSIVTRDFTIDMTSKDLFNCDLAELNVLNYDVILVGFVNPDKKLSDVDTLLNKLAIAASKGKGVIFTQDSLTYFNDNTDAVHWGSNTNYRIRQLLGMDRFRAYSAGATTVQASEMTFTYNVLNQFSSNKYFSGLEESIPVTEYVTRINDGKITRYPYVIKTEADGFSTKSGIYQADADQTGFDVQMGVGYFCLSDGSSEINYSVSPNDIRNNYYLWRNDSTFYSGVTRDSFSGNGGSLNHELEVKLFINTIISAYGLEHSVNIKVTNLHQLSDYAYGKQYILYGDVDFSKDEISGYKAVDFNLTTVGMKNPEIIISFYQADSKGNIVGDPLKMERSEKTFRVSTGGSAQTTFKVSKDTEYVFHYPYSFLSSGANKNIVLMATATENGKATTDQVFIKAIRRSMFELD